METIQEAVASGTSRWSRRRVLLSCAAAALAAGAPLARAARRRHPPMAILGAWPMAMQLWTVNAQLKQDVPRTLAAVKAAGYDVVETAGLLGRTATQFRRLLDDAGLDCRSAHLSMADLLADPGRATDDARALGAKWLVCASPKPPVAIGPDQDWLVAMRDAMTADAWKANAAHLATLAPVAHRAGLKLTYHNHFMEFTAHDGVTGFDTLLAAVEPAMLRLELDVGWVRVAGRDPLAILEAYSARIDLLHVKDMVADAAQPIGFRSTEVGKGMIEWAPLLRQARASGVKGLFVEQEEPYLRDVFESLAISNEYLRRLA